MRKYSIVCIAKKIALCRSQPFQHLPESTIFLIQGLKIWLLIRGISPVFADIYFAKILHRFYRKTICALPLATISTFVGVNYIPHSGTKICLLIHGISPVFADIYFSKTLHSFYRKKNLRYFAGFRRYLFRHNTP